MGVNIINVRDYEPSSQDSFFFDNNIWMFIFGPMANVNMSAQKYYGILLDKIISRDASIFINSMILSEFANTWLRIDYNNYKKSINNHSLKYKAEFGVESYLTSDRYKETVREINDNIDKILEHSEKTSDSFQNINLDAITNFFEDIDFNDSYILQFVKQKRYKLVTEDRDFILVDVEGVDVVTLNS